MPVVLSDLSLLLANCIHDRPDHFAMLHRASFWWCVTNKSLLAPLKSSFSTHLHSIFSIAHQLTFTRNMLSVGDLVHGAASICYPGMHHTSYHISNEQGGPDSPHHMCPDQQRIQGRVQIISGYGATVIPSP